MAGLYVEARIRGDLDELWARTQDPAMHRRWDLRFTDIDYLPPVAGEPQGFRYATRVLPFLTIAGTGVCAGEKERPDGTRTSALRFGSPHPLSLLAEGAGYWRYIPDGAGVRFLTGYDYRPRWGRPGALADRLLLRPLMGWATAWSFDRLRLWLERGITPERALRHWLAETAGRGLLLATATAVVGTAAELAPAAGGGEGTFGTAVRGALGGTLWAGAGGVLLPAVLLTLTALLAPPLPGTPAARRCLRTPPGRVRAPRLAATLEHRP